MTQDIATFGSVHLNVTHLEESIHFWKEYIGMKVIAQTAEYTTLGTESNTLIVLYPCATRPFSNGHSGLYHLALHATNEIDFARILQRLIAKRYPISPTDHTMSKAIYLEDPDGITIEITLETPERFDRYEFGNGTLEVLDSEGNLNSAAAPLDVASLLSALPDNQIINSLAEDTKIGHMHLYVSNIESSIGFYQSLGFTPNPRGVGFPFADLGAGGEFTHRIGINNWQSSNKPHAPDDTAGMRYFTIIFHTHKKLEIAITNGLKYLKQDDGYLVTDPSGNRMLLQAND